MINREMTNMVSQHIGDTIPNNNQHAVSVTLPTWEATVGYEEGQDWVVSQMSSGYPRFFIHSVIQLLIGAIENKYGRSKEKCMVFPSYKVAKRCRAFMEAHGGHGGRVLQLTSAGPKTEGEKSTVVETSIGVVFFDPQDAKLAKNYWQHSGECISSRQAEYLMARLFSQTAIAITGDQKSAIQAQKIQQMSPSLKQFNRDKDDDDVDGYIDQKYGRVLDLKFAGAAKVALRRRIITNVSNVHKHELLDLDQITSDNGATKIFHEDDVYLCPTGMSAIFQCHQALLNIYPAKKSVCFGFPYVDTLNILNKFGPGSHFLGLGDDQSLDELETNLELGTWSILALFCECPSNPLLKTPNLYRIRQLADKFDFAVVVDDTIGNFININTLPYADMVATSLTKVFSGSSDVMGGSIVINQDSKHYHALKAHFNANFEDLLWAKDALVLERNSRDYITRSQKVNQNALAVVEFLQNCALIKHVYYPKLCDTRPYYDAVKTPTGGYGGLISFLFHDPNDAICFFNAMNFHKGPSLGTNFTLACPYTILAHYQELDQVEKWNVDRNLIRISIGMEDTSELLAVMQQSLDITLRRV